MEDEINGYFVIELTYLIYHLPSSTRDLNYLAFQFLDLMISEKIPNKVSGRTYKIVNNTYIISDPLLF